MNRRTSLICSLIGIAGGLLGGLKMFAPKESEEAMDLAMLSLMDGGLYSTRSGLNGRPIVGRVEWSDKSGKMHSIPTCSNETLQHYFELGESLLRRKLIASCRVIIYEGGEITFPGPAANFVTLPGKECGLRVTAAH